MKGRQRRWIAATFTAFCLALTAGTLQYFRDHLGDESTFSGWTLLASTAGLYLLSVRKKWIQLRLGPVAAWLQVHSYMGVFASLVFLMHIGWPIRGAFESCLALVFVIVAVSGMTLGILSRSTPKRLMAVPQDYAYERIPTLQLSVANEAHRVALESVELDEGATLSEYYQRRLLPYFQSQRGMAYWMFPNGKMRRTLLRELQDLDRYLGRQGVSSRKTLSAMVQSKDDLDFHLAMQSRLRIMFTLHVSLTLAMAILIAVHVVLVYRFQDVM